MIQIRKKKHEIPQVTIAEIKYCFKATAGLCLLSPLYSRLKLKERQSKGFKESEEERKKTGQLQCGEVCRVSRERELKE